MTLQQHKTSHNTLRDANYKAKQLIANNHHGITFLQNDVIDELWTDVANPKLTRKSGPKLDLGRNYVSGLTMLSKYAVKPSDDDSASTARSGHYSRKDAPYPLRHTYEGASKSHE